MLDPHRRHGIRSNCRPFRGPAKVVIEGVSMTVHRWDFFWPVSKLQGAQLADLGTAEINMTAETVRIQLWRGDELVVEGNGYFAQGTTHDGRFDAEIRWDTASIVSDDG